MSDVRLTATNPEDSTVVPVACNERGELLVTKTVIEQIDNDVLIDGALTANTLSVSTPDPGDYTQVGGANFLACRQAGVQNTSFAVNLTGQVKVRKVAGEVFKGYAFVGTDDNAFEVRNKNNNTNWTVSYGGVAGASGFVINTDTENPDNWKTVTRDGESTSTYIGPVLDVGAELVFLRAQVRSLMEKLKMTPEGGWEVWDGESAS